MSVGNIRALLDCDGCGIPFLVDVDPAASSSKRIGKWTPFDLATDACAASMHFIKYVTPTSRPDEQRHTSVVDGQYHLCPHCTFLVSRRVGPLGLVNFDFVKRLLDEFELEEFD